MGRVLGRRRKMMMNLGGMLIFVFLFFIVGDLERVHAKNKNKK